ncbi:MATE family efflux transporter [bacterium]|nr:MATE family efflux transporter [bacterium]
MISQTLLSVVDTAMVGRLGAISLAATGLGGILTWTIIGSVSALHVGAQAVAARRFGEKNFVVAGKTLDNALWLAVVVGILTTVLSMWAMSHLFGLFTSDPLVEAEGKRYIMYRLMGTLPFMVIMAFRGFYNGVGDTHLHMNVMIVINATNVLLNWVFIFGHLGAPAMGSAGAGLASTLGTILGMLLFIAIAIGYKRRDNYNYFKWSNLDRDTMRRIVRLAVPSGIRNFLVMLGFSAFSAIVSGLGTVQMAATNVVLTILSLSYMPGAGFGFAAATLIGQKLGEGDPDGAEEYGWESARLSLLTMGVLGIVFIFFPDLLFRLFTDDAEVIAYGTLPLRIMGAIQVFDAMGMVLSFALEGAGMNRWVLYAELCVNWLIFLPASYILAYIVGWGLTGAWMAFSLYLVIFSILVTRKFMGGTWKTVEV